MVEVVVQEVSEGLRMGDGEFPEDLDRVNWSAVMWGGLWFITYGAWWWLLLLTAVIVVSAAAFNYLPFLDQSAVLASYGMTIITQLMWYVVVIAGARQANRIVWTREKARVARQSDQSVPRPARLVSEYVESQRKWTILGLGFLILQLAGSLARSHGAPAGTSMAGWATSVLCMTALYLVERTRRSRASQS